MQSIKMPHRTAYSPVAPMPWFTRPLTDSHRLTVYARMLRPRASSPTQERYHQPNLDLASEYMRVPAMAMDEPTTPSGEMGVLKAITEAMMMTTRLMVLPPAWVTGLTRPRARKATSLYR